MHRTVEQRAPTNLHEKFEIWAPIVHIGDAVGERVVEENCFRIGVREEMEQLVGEVAIVDIARHRSLLERCKLNFFVFKTVVQVEPDLVVMANPRCPERCRYAGRAILEFGPRMGVESVRSGGGPRNCIDNPLPNRREVRHHNPPESR